MKPAVLECVRGLGYVSAFQNHPVQAAQLLAAVEALMEGMDFVLRPEKADHDRALAAVRADLDDGAFRAAWAEGRTMTLEQAIENALDVGIKRESGGTFGAATCS
jgi:hypothetical protein